MAGKLTNRDLAFGHSQHFVYTSQSAMKYPCPCCGYRVFEEPPGSWDICPICFWEDDLSQLRFAHMAGGANRLCLADAQRNYTEKGVSQPGMEQHVRRPSNYDLRDEAWRPIDSSRDDIEEPVRGVDYGGTYPGETTLLYYWKPTYWRRFGP